MQEKDIKRLVIKQLKTKFPYWRRLTKKQKQALAEKAIIEVMEIYKPDQAVNVPLHELIHMPALPADIIPLSTMGKFIEDRSRSFFPFIKQYSHDTGEEFGCDAQPKECFRAPLCPQCRELPFDSGYLGQLPDSFEEVDQIRRLRNLMERSYNLFKHGAGFERLRLKSLQSVMAAVTFEQLATVLREISRHHQAAEKEPRPKQLQFAA
jgi:hypothetical protein